MSWLSISINFVNFEIILHLHQNVRISFSSHQYDRLSRHIFSGSKLVRLLLQLLKVQLLRLAGRNVSCRCDQCSLDRTLVQNKRSFVVGLLKDGKQNYDFPKNYHFNLDTSSWRLYNGRTNYLFDDDGLHHWVVWVQNGLRLHGLVVNLRHGNNLRILFPQIWRELIFVNEWQSIGPKFVWSTIYFTDLIFNKMLRTQTRGWGRLPLGVHQVVPNGEDPLFPLFRIPRKGVSVADPTTRWNETSLIFVHWKYASIETTYLGWTKYF